MTLKDKPQTAPCLERATLRRKGKKKKIQIEIVSEQAYRPLKTTCL